MAAKKRTSDLKPTTPPAEWPPFLYVVDWAALLEVGRQHIYRLIQRGQLPPPVMDKRSDPIGSMKWRRETVRQFVYGGAHVGRRV